MKQLFILIACTLTLNSFAQPKNHSFGVLNPEDLQLKACSFEKDASAVVLFDYGKTQFIESPNFTLQQKRHTRIKIFNEGGYDQAQIVIPLYMSKTNKEKITKIEGFTYNMIDGILEKTPLDITQVFEEKVSEYLYVTKFAMPKIKDGSIIEYTYTMESPYLENFIDWEFQSDIPTLYSQFTAAMIPFFSYRYRIQGTNTLDHQKSYEAHGIDRHFAGIVYKDMIYEFGLKNIPSLTDESFISTRNDYITKLDFQLVEINYPNGQKVKYMDTWPGLANDLLDNDSFGKYLKKAQKWAEKEANNFAELPEKERADAILNMIKSTYKWDGYYGKTAFDDLKEMQKSLQGNAGNINLTAIATMRANGLDAKPVIISTRNHGKVNDEFPYSDFFNYTLILVKTDDELQIMDATRGFCPNNLIPPYCINGKGFIVEEDSESWINITNNAPSIDETNLNYSINIDENKIEGNCSKSSTGYFALSNRKSYYSDADEFKKGYEDLGISADNEMKVNYLMEEDKPFEYSFDFKQDIDNIDGQIILNPFAHFAIKENPFKQENRRLPIDIVTKKAHKYNVVITLPEGYKVSNLPSPRSIRNNDIEFNYMIQQLDNNKIQLYAMYTFKKSMYPKESYQILKRTMNDVTNQLNSKIIITKIDDLTMNEF